jgi:hypothetical protein
MTYRQVESASRASTNATFRTSSRLRCQMTASVATCSTISKRFTASVALRGDVADAGAAMIRNMFDGALKSRHMATRL